MKQKLKKIKELLRQIGDAAISDKSIKATMFEIGALTSSVIYVVNEIESENIIKASNGFAELKVDSNDHYNDLLDACEKYRKRQEKPTQDEIIQWSENFESKINNVNVRHTTLTEEERAKAIKDRTISIDEYMLQKADTYAVSKHDEKPELPNENTEDTELTDESIKQETKQYIIERYGELSINSFLDLFTEKSDQFETKSSDLYNLYKVESQAKKPMHTIEFSEKLIDKGFEKKKIKGCMYWNLRVK